MSEEKKILIIDDEQDAIDIADAMLSEIDGVTVISANDGDSGLLKAKNINGKVKKCFNRFMTPVPGSYSARQCWQTRRTRRCAKMAVSESPTR